MHSKLLQVKGSYQSAPRSFFNLPSGNQGGLAGKSHHFWWILPVFIGLMDNGNITINPPFLVFLICNYRECSIAIFDLSDS